jgi:hypothetical protein
VGVDLWNAQTDDGRSIRKALDFLVPIATGEKKWDYQEIEGGVKPEMLFPVMRRAAAIFRDKPYQTVMAKVPDPSPSDAAVYSRSARQNKRKMRAKQFGCAGNDAL